MFSSQDSFDSSFTLDKTNIVSLNTIVFFVTLYTHSLQHILDLSLNGKTSRP